MNLYVSKVVVVELINNWLQEQGTVLIDGQLWCSNGIKASDFELAFGDVLVEVQPLPSTHEDKMSGGKGGVE